MLFCTTAFEPLAKAQRKALGLEHLPLVVLPHPIGGQTADAAKAKANDAWPQVEEWLKEVTAPAR
jgi:hypothetical protein